MHTGRFDGELASVAERFEDFRRAGVNVQLFSTGWHISYGRSVNGT